MISRKDYIHMLIASLVFLIGYVALLSHFFLSLTLTSPALDKSKDAILEYPKVKEYKSNGERELYLRLKNDWGITKDHVIAAGVGYEVLVKGEVSTKPFKSLRYRHDNLEVKPEATYLYRNQEGQGKLSFSWGW